MYIYLVFDRFTTLRNMHIYISVFWMKMCVTVHVYTDVDKSFLILYLLGSYSFFFIFFFFMLLCCCAAAFCWCLCGLLFVLH